MKNKLDIKAKIGVGLMALVIILSFLVIGLLLLVPTSTDNSENLKEVKSFTDSDYQYIKETTQILSFTSENLFLSIDIIYFYIDYSDLEGTDTMSADLMDEQASQMRELLEWLDELKPSNDYKEYHNHLRKAIVLIADGTQLVADGMRYSNENYMAQGNDKILEAQEELLKASKS